MKELIKKRWFLVTFGILAIIGILAIVAISFWGVLYLKGFRFVYPEQFENSWNAVSGIAAWAGVVVSVISALASSLAIVFAVRVADKQNKIALFEKRYELFNFVDRCELFDHALKRNKDIKNIRHLFLLDFFDILPRSKADDNDFFTQKIGYCFDRTKQTEFLFKNSDIHVLMEILSTIVYKIVHLALNPEGDAEETDALNSVIEEFTKFVNGENYKKLVDAMQKELSLK